VDDEQGQKGEEPEAFNDALTRILQPFDPNMSAGTNSGLCDSSAGKPKYLPIVAGGATKEAVESTDASSLGRDPLDPYFEADLAAARQVRVRARVRVRRVRQVRQVRVRSQVQVQVQVYGGSRVVAL
jgi:hypothetical protein